MHGDSVIATKSAGTDFKSVKRNTDVLDMTTPGVGDAETVLPMTESFSGRSGNSLMQWLSSPVVWSVIVLILSGVGILRELL